MQINVQLSQYTYLVCTSVYQLVDIVVVVYQDVEIELEWLEKSPDARQSPLDQKQLKMKLTSCYLDL